jgi:hypothetical protein
MEQMKQITGLPAMALYAIMVVFFGFLLYFFTFAIVIGFILGSLGLVNPTNEMAVLVIESIAILVLGFLAEGKATRALMIYSLIMMYIIFGLAILFHF